MKRLPEDGETVGSGYLSASSAFFLLSTVRIISV